MSPLRGWMREHGMPSWYSWVVVILVPIMASLAVLVVSLKVNERSLQRERQARETLAQAQEDSRQALCRMLVLLDDSYRRQPPTTPAGVELARAVSEARTLNRCPGAR